MNRLTGWLVRQSDRIDWVIRLVGVVGFAALVILYGDFRSYVECQASYNEVINARTRILAEAATQERTAQRATDDAERLLFTDPLLTKPAADRTPAERERLTELFRRYQMALTNLEEERVQADRARAANPVPPPPSVACN